MTREHLLQIMPLNWAVKPGMTPEEVEKRKQNIADTYLPYINEFTAKHGINTLVRQAAFLAQIAHESGELRYMREIWGPTKAQKGYEGRKDLGNVYPGDGKRFMGRGIIQITGRANYAACSVALTGKADTFLNTPELLSTPMYAVQSACWFWASRGLNELADTQDIKRVTKRINGGYNGLEDRIKYWERAKNIIG